MKKKKTTTALARRTDAYADFAGDIAALLEQARHQAARSVNAILTATYWEIGRRIVEFEQKGKRRAAYGEQLLVRLSQDLTAGFGRGFGVDNLQRMRSFFLAFPPDKIYATLSRKSPSTPIPQTPSAKSLDEYLAALAQAFPMSWSHYVRLLSVRTPEARAFYETEAVRGGWSGNMLNKIMAAEYRLTLPDPKQLEAELEKTRRMLESPTRKP